MNVYPQEAILKADLLASQRLLSQEYGIPWRDCSTVVFLNSCAPAHHEMPPWLNPYDMRILEDNDTLKRWHRRGKTPTTMYEQRINSLALRKLGKTWDDLKSPADWAAFRGAKEQVRPELEEATRAFLVGFTDDHGHYWCGHCYDRYQLLQLGAALKYPALWTSKAGYEAWFATARFAGHVAVADDLRLARRMQIERRQLQAVNATD